MTRFVVILIKDNAYIGGNVVEAPYGRDAEEAILNRNKQWGNKIDGCAALSLADLQALIEQLQAKVTRLPMIAQRQADGSFLAVDQ